MFKNIFGDPSTRALKEIKPTVKKIESLSDEYRALSDEALQAKTKEFKARYANGETLDHLLPEAFATVREASFRVLGMYPYTVQLIGGIILHQGRIAEMKTGEGKTLVAALPAYLNAIAGNGVHIVTVNDYLAKRDSELIGKIHRFLGLTVGLVIPGMETLERKTAYAADITYGTNNEMGFDYLRDNMCHDKGGQVQRGHAFVIVDEVDSILIDEARTPLIISSATAEATDIYAKAEELVSHLRCKKVKELDSKTDDDMDMDADYVVDEKAKSVTLTTSGIKKAESFYGLSNLADAENGEINHLINQALRAHGTMTKNIDYVIKDGEVIIVDEFTGRLMIGRRYSNGLHQAIEAKEHVEVQGENKTLATVTFQNYFRLYRKLSGMTGTAMTEREEFGTIYNLDIVEIPTNRPNQRKDNPDAVYKTAAGKYHAVVEQVKTCHAKGQPILVGTASIEKNELISELLKKEGIPHHVLNAKNHEQEAEIVAQAGKLGAVTVATNMAGRGTDIMLGGNAEYLARADLIQAGYSEEVIVDATGYADTDDEEILEARKLFAERQEFYKKEISEEAKKVYATGGLFIAGTERHESRRIDNQLRGRAGRQGDPGETRFFLSMEDDLIRLFGGDRMSAMMDRFNLDENIPLDNKFLSKSIENAQTTVESRNFQARKSVLEYDDVMNQQRKLIYEQRNKVLDGEDIKPYIMNMMRNLVQEAVMIAYNGNNTMPVPCYNRLMATMRRSFFEPDNLHLDPDTVMQMKPDDLTKLLTEAAEKDYQERENYFTPPILRSIERYVLLRTVDEHWMEHIDAMDDLKQNVSLQAWANKKPIDIFKENALEVFETMIHSIQSETIRRIHSTQIQKVEMKQEEAEV